MREGVYDIHLRSAPTGEAEIMVETAASLERTGAEKREPPNTAKAAESIEEAEMRLILDTLRRCKYNHNRSGSSSRDRTKHALAETEEDAPIGKVIRPPQYASWARRCALIFINRLVVDRSISSSLFVMNLTFRAYGGSSCIQAR